MVTSLLHWSEVIIRPMKDGNGKRSFKLGPIVTMSCYPWDSDVKVSNLSPPQLISLYGIILTFFHYSYSKTNQNPHHKTLLFLVYLASKLQAQMAPDCLKPSQPNDPPIPGLSQPSESYEDAPNREPEPEVAPLQSLEEPFVLLHPPPVPPPSTPTAVPSTEIPPISPRNPTASSPQSHDEAQKEYMEL
ncbi:hypothetical protein O181_004577 [Austropuccinia psidii MF-1]|uniref:Uncharacterized protein n=1 Tax=Austropuccinia psidii MF-1 TaxID=1389203 RepID=A0A9Q3GFX4_9BASI|nr:hypothetical protein [Austropuccinia psidii MF-1]